MKGRASVYETLRRIGVVTWSLVGVVLFVSLVVWAIIQVKNIIPAVVLATAIIYILNPLVTRLHGRGVPRLLGSCLSYLALGAIVTAVVWLAFPSIADQGRQLSDDFPQIYDDLAIEATVFPVDGMRQALISPVDGRPMKRADSSAVRKLLDDA